MISRTEKIQWTFNVSGEMYKENYDLFGMFNTVVDPDQVNDKDVVSVEYKFFIDYIGAICSSLEAVLSLRARGVPCEVSQEELFHGRCLIQQVFKAMEELAS